MRISEDAKNARSTLTFTFVFCLRNLVILEIGFGIFGLGIFGSRCHSRQTRHLKIARSTPPRRVSIHLGFSPLLSFSRSRSEDREGFVYIMLLHSNNCVRSTGAKFTLGRSEEQQATSRGEVTRPNSTFRNINTDALREVLHSEHATNQPLPTLPLNTLV